MKVPKFYYPYYGGKSKEIKHVRDLFELSDYDTIVEPFCGSCSFSLYCYSLAPKKSYHVNDLDEKLIGLLKDVKENGSKKYFDYCAKHWKNGKTTRKQYDAIRKMDTLEAMFYVSRIYKIHKELYPIGKQFYFRHEKYENTDSFFKNATVSNENYKEIMEQYKDDPRALLFLDPPYFLSCNVLYKDNGHNFGKSKLTPTSHEDQTEGFKYIRDFLQVCRCKVILIIKDCCLLHDYYKDFFVKNYDVTYQTKKNKSLHGVFSNT